VNAVLSEVAEVCEVGVASAALGLTFLPQRSRLIVERIEDRVALGPTGSVAAALGLARVLRLLRAARIAAPPEPASLLGDPIRAAALLRRALGVEVALELQPRSTVRFTVWTDHGVQSVDDVADVIEDDHAWLIHRRGGRPPVLFARNRVVRRQTDCETWFEVTAVERLA
jgi:hypothetical protein